jgi:hypothetical protein
MSHCHGGRVGHNDALKVLKTRISVDLVVQLNFLPVVLVGLVFLVHLPHVHFLRIRKQSYYLRAVTLLVKYHLELQPFQRIVRSQVFLRVGVLRRGREDGIERES